MQPILKLLDLPFRECADFHAIRQRVACYYIGIKPFLFLSPLLDIFAHPLDECYCLADRLNSTNKAPIPGAGKIAKKVSKYLLEKVLSRKPSNDK
jgi:hypothetical protein